MFIIKSIFHRLFSSAASARPIPPPSESVKDVAGFLGRIKRNCETHATKIGSWEGLFSMDGKAMEKAGIPVKQRRWILLWAEKYRQGVEPYFIRPSRKDKRPKKTTRKAFKHL